MESTNKEEQTPQRKNVFQNYSTINQHSQDNISREIPLDFSLPGNNPFNSKSNSERTEDRSHSNSNRNIFSQTQEKTTRNTINEKRISSLNDEIVSHIKDTTSNYIGNNALFEKIGRLIKTEHQAINQINSEEIQAYFEYLLRENQTL